MRIEMRSRSFEEIKMIKRNNAERPGPHGVAIASQYIHFPCVVSFNHFFNRQQTSIYLCFLEPHGPKLQLACA